MNVNAESEAGLRQAELSEKTGISMFFGIRLPLGIRFFTAFSDCVGTAEISFTE